MRCRVEPLLGQHIRGTTGPVDGRRNAIGMPDMAQGPGRDSIKESPVRYVQAELN